jgi:hypothetical protein
MRSIRAGSHGNAAFWLKEAVDILAQMELGPAAHDLSSIERFVGYARGIHAARVAAERNGANPWREVQTTGLQDNLFPRVLLQLRPRTVGVLGKLDVLRSVIGKPDNSGMILRLTTHMSQLELLDAQHVCARTAGEPIRRGTAKSAQAENDVFVILFQNHSCHG